MSKLLKMMFEYDRWMRLLDKAEEKEINRSLLQKLTTVTERKNLAREIATGQYHVAPPRKILIPKDTPGEYREVKANEDRDRIVLTLINDCLMELFADMISPHCRSYQRGMGTKEAVAEAVELTNRYDYKKHDFVAIKTDLSKYFDSVYIEVIDAVFDAVEARLGYVKGTEPVINLLREYYHSDWLYDLEGNLVEEYTSLKQGCAVASFLSNVILYDIDEKLSAVCEKYIRYCDDMLLIGKGAKEGKSLLDEELPKYGLKLNPKKVSKIYSDEWFTFLGFKIKSDMVTLSKKRVQKFSKEIRKRTIDHRKISGKQAKRNVMRYLYEGEYCWANSCFGLINVEKDLNELNKFIMDCIKACETGKKKIGGIGSCDQFEDYTILRSKGRNVRANREKVPHIENYLTVKCLQDNYSRCKEVFEAAVRNASVASKRAKKVTQLSADRSVCSQLIELGKKRNVTINLNERRVFCDKKELLLTDNLIQKNDLLAYGIEDCSDFYQTVEFLYQLYKRSIPSSSMDKRQSYFKPLSYEELSTKDLVENMPRNEAAVLLESFILCAGKGNILPGTEEYDGYYYQSKNEPDLILFKEWVA